ncbi:MAG: hypothetical protein ACRD6X_10185 [Pyrinomonadaceae bacterium]
MKSFVSLGVVLFALTFCGIGDKLKNIGRGSSNSNSANTAGGPSKTSSGGVETPSMTGPQQAIADAGTEMKWDDQGISWKLPVGWPKLELRKESLNYGSPANGFLIGTISVMPASFPSETSLDATYTSSLEQLKQGKYEDVRWLEIDGVKGVEWVEAMPEDKDGPRRHQWIAFRNYQGQNQQLNIMVSTKGSNFDKQRDTFAAILYSMKIAKG